MKCVWLIYLVPLFLLVSTTCGRKLKYHDATQAAEVRGNDSERRIRQSTDGELKEGVKSEVAEVPEDADEEAKIDDVDRAETEDADEEAAIDDVDRVETEDVDDDDADETNDGAISGIGSVLDKQLEEDVPNGDESGVGNAPELSDVDPKSSGTSEDTDDLGNDKDKLAVGNVGWGNTGSYNTGWGNSGYGNTGWGNTGYGNCGWGNNGWGNTGVGNSGYGNSGWGNSGWGNYGWGNDGWGNIGWGNTDVSWGNSGYGNSGVGNSGYGNSGNVDWVCWMIPLNC